MELIQFVGPFSQGQRKTVTGNIKHIGIQIPDRQPIEINDKAVLSPDLSINNIEYKINKNDILEFDNLSIGSMSFTFLKNLPKETIIDIAVEEGV